MLVGKLNKARREVVNKNVVEQTHYNRYNIEKKVRKCRY